MDTKNFTLADVTALTEEQALAYFETIRWPNGPNCAHCGSANVVRLQGKSTRLGTFKCRECRKPFTVKVGTIMEDSHLSYRDWAIAFHMMCSSKKGYSAKQLQRNLGIKSYKSAWHMAYRIRYAMTTGPLAELLKGTVETDETYVGGKPRKYDGKIHKRGRGTRKSPVVALVQRGGNVRTRPVNSVDAKTLKAAIRENVSRDATIMTDELPAYRRAVRGFCGGHLTVNHALGEYSRDGVNTNTAESFFALLKRGIYGTFHSVSRQHLHRYCNEFSFRWNHRDVTDGERTEQAIRCAEGKRLTYG
jgi:transposase-like protein